MHGDDWFENDQLLSIYFTLKFLSLRCNIKWLDFRRMMHFILFIVFSLSDEIVKQMNIQHNNTNKIIQIKYQEYEEETASREQTERARERERTRIWFKNSFQHKDLWAIFVNGFAWFFRSIANTTNAFYLYIAWPTKLIAFVLSVFFPRNIQSTVVFLFCFVISYKQTFTLMSAFNENVRTRVQMRHSTYARINMNGSVLR